MKKTILFLSFFCCIYLSNAQEITCDDLLDFVKTEGYKESSVSSIALIDSSWLNGVEAYSYDGNLFVVAKIKKDEYSYYSKEYIFCGVPEENWRKFKSLFDIDKTYGERFHEYIIDYQCNCY